MLCRKDIETSFSQIISLFSEKMWMPLCFSSLNIQDGVGQQAKKHKT